MRSLASLGPRSVRRDAGRYVLTAIGIALGVGVVFGILLTNESVTRSFDRQLGQGPPGLVLAEQSGTFGGDLPAALVAQAARLPGVSAANGNLGFWVPVQGGRDQVYVSGDLFERGAAPPAKAGAGGSARQRLEGREPSPGSDEILIGGDPVARLLHARLGSVLSLAGPTGVHTFTVSGIRHSDSRGGAQATMAAVLRATGKGDVVTSVSIQLGQGVDRTQWIADHAQDLAGVRLVGPNQGLVDLRNLYDAVRGSFAGLAAVAMFVGAFLVFLTLSMAVIERTRLYGTLRALGASRGQILRVVMGEALALGTLSTAAGLLLGLVVGAGFLGFVARVYGLPQPRFAVPATAVVEAVAIGVLTTAGAALVPALRASRLSPVEAIRGSYAQDRRLSRSWALGAVILAAGLVCSRLTIGPLLRAGSPLILLGAVLMVPLLTRPVARVAGRVTRRLAPGLGDIGVMHLVKERSRSAYTLALVMVVLALVLAAGSIHRSYRAAQDLGLRRAFPADMAVYGGQRLDATFTSRVGATPGVQSVTELRFGETNVEGRGATRVFLSVIDPDTFFAVQPLPWVAGSDGSARRALQRGDAVIVPQGLARRFGVGMGGRLDLTTAQGRHRFSVVGIYPTNDSFRSVTVGLPDARRYFNAGDANSVAVRLAPGADPHAVSEAIQAGMRTHGGAFVRLTSSDKARARKALDDYFRLVYVVLLVAGTMGLLGLGNTLAMSVIGRTREIGVLRAIGTRRRQVWGLVLVESATLSLVALALALPLGWVLSVTILRASLSTLGVVVAYRQPGPVVPVIGALALLTAAVAAVAPARRAARVEPVAALRFE